MQKKFRNGWKSVVLILWIAHELAYATNLQTNEKIWPLEKISFNLELFCSIKSLNHRIVDLFVTKKQLHEPVPSIQNKDFPLLVLVEFDSGPRKLQEHQNSSSKRQCLIQVNFNRTNQIICDPESISNLLDSHIQGLGTTVKQVSKQSNYSVSQSAHNSSLENYFLWKVNNNNNNNHSQILKELIEFVCINRYRRVPIDPNHRNRTLTNYTKNEFTSGSTTNKMDNNFVFTTTQNGSTLLEDYRNVNKLKEESTGKEFMKKDSIEANSDKESKEKEYNKEKFENKKSTGKESEKEESDEEIFKKQESKRKESEKEKSEKEEFEEENTTEETESEETESKEEGSEEEESEEDPEEESMEEESEEEESKEEESEGEESEETESEETESEETESEKTESEKTESEETESEETESEETESEKTESEETESKKEESEEKKYKEDSEEESMEKESEEEESEGKESEEEKTAEETETVETEYKEEEEEEEEYKEEPEEESNEKLDKKSNDELNKDLNKSRIDSKTKQNIIDLLESPMNDNNSTWSNIRNKKIVIGLDTKENNETKYEIQNREATKAAGGGTEAAEHKDEGVSEEPQAEGVKAGDSESNSGLHLGVIIGMCAIVGTFIIIAFIIFCCLCQPSKEKKKPSKGTFSTDKKRSSEKKFSDRKYY